MLHIQDVNTRERSLDFTAEEQFTGWLSRTNLSLRSAP